MSSLGREEILRRAGDVRLLVVDVDGVLTDGRIILDNEGNEFKAFHVRDGHGIKMVQRAGITVAIITGRSSAVVDRRARELGIREVHQGARDKVPVFTEMLVRLGVSEDETAYMGDDIVDVPLLVRAGLSVAVADSDPTARAHAHLVTKHSGGRGAVREITDLILQAQGLWDDIIKKYTQV